MVLDVDCSQTLSVCLVCVKDFLSFVFCFFTQHCKKHINMLIVFFEREDVDRR